MADDALTPKQRLFCQEYMLDMNGAAAARRAGYSDDSAITIASQLLAQTNVWTRIAELMDARMRRVEVTADEIVRELKRIAFGDTRRIAEWGPNGVRLNDSASLTDDEAAMISEVSETTTVGGGSIKFKRNDKLRALELLMKHKGMLREGGMPEEATPEPKQIIFTVADASTSDTDEHSDADA